MSDLNANQKKLYELALKHNEDPAKWLALYQIESASGTKLINHQSGATGHFQIMPKFFKDYGVTREGAMDLETSFLAVKKHHERGSAKLQAVLGRELSAGEYYLGHQQGWGGATALLSNRDKNVVDALATIMKRDMAEKSVIQNGGKTSMTAGQFADMWVSKADKLQQDYTNRGYGRPNEQSMHGSKETSMGEAQSQSKYDEVMAMIQGLINDTDGSYAQKVLEEHADKVARFDEKVRQSIEQDRQRELADRESQTMQHEEQQRGFSRSFG